MEKTINNDIYLCDRNDVQQCNYYLSDKCGRYCNLFDNEQGDVTDISKLEKQLENNNTKFININIIDK
jgi:hypothetical protein